MALAEILRCRHCGRELRLMHDGDYTVQIFRNAVSYSLSYLCDAPYQDQFTETGMKPLLHHEPMLKSDYIKKFIEVCLTENT